MQNLYLYFLPLQWYHFWWWMKLIVFQNGELLQCHLTWYLLTWYFRMISLNWKYFNRSHNFRPSYMRLKASLLRTRLNVQCILAMTATATTKTLNDVMCALEIPQTNLIKSAHMRDNLQLSVSLSRNRQVWIHIVIFRYHASCFYGWWTIHYFISGSITCCFSFHPFTGCNWFLPNIFAIIEWRIWWRYSSPPPLWTLKASLYTANFR